MSDKILIIEEGQKLCRMPVIPLRGMAVMPAAIIHFEVSRDKSIQALESAMLDQGRIFLVAQKEGAVEEPGQEQLYSTGTIAQIKQITKMPNHVVRVLVEGTCRGVLRQLNEENDRFLEATVEEAAKVRQAGKKRCSRKQCCAS